MPDLIRAVNLQVRLPDLMDLGQQSFIVLGTDATQFRVALPGSMVTVA